VTSFAGRLEHVSVRRWSGGRGGREHDRGGCECGRGGCERGRECDHGVGGHEHGLRDERARSNAHVHYEIQIPRQEPPDQ
jgi:hypothetical protein